MILFGAVLIQHRERTKLTQKEVAERIGVCKTTYHNWESDKRVFTVDYLPKLAEVFGIDVVDLFPGGLQVRVIQPANEETGATFDARQLYEDLVGSLRETIALLRDENNKLRMQARQTHASFD
ncbi:helix-turn-helix transcriptional regulator [Spirosoma montaniterrae]|uniref:HTH cro/C1-type domain-containing protein n=1 Tax=Spirosoma montaniterrae TaxID=1178516 RepID=A0A1P9WU81_9BACT|nr:helix-turn-helix transcriptional regulator [Spirosoma montaniterrae]AQG78942.1 hypothetical protein AWR27_06140 [Spirosoma montaniterrae]